MNSVVKNNLELMAGTAEGQMTYQLMQESFGGNAGFYKIKSGRERTCSCAAVNFFYDPQTGSIALFGNIQDVPRGIIRSHAEGTFRIALDTFNSWKTKIVNVYIKGSVPEQARRNILDSAAEYNSRYGF